MTRKYNKYKTSNNRVQIYYDDALRIANSFNTLFIPYDDKEGIALLALIRASRTYKKEVPDKKTKKLVPIKFSTHLMNCVKNALVNYVKRSKEHGPIFHNRRVVKLDKVTDKLGLPMYELRFDDFDPYKIAGGADANSSFNSLFDLLEEPHKEDTLVLKELFFLARKRLNPTQNKIIDFYYDSSKLYDVLGIVDEKPGSKECTYDKIGQALNCSRQRIGQQMKIIRNVFTKVQKEQSSENFKLTKNEREELYG